jgi:flavorubredoxin
MFSYLPADKLLFSNDAFGMHLASNERYADEIEDYILQYEGEKYYANILLPYSPLIRKLLDKVASAGLEFDMILPDHGPIWRTKEDIAKIIGFYGEWAEQKPAKKAVILFDTMWNSTEKMAHVISEGLIANDVEAHLMPMKTTHRSDAVKEVLDCGALIAGSPTLNNNIFPSMADVMTYLKGLRPQNLIGAAFGSYGWSGESIGILENMLTEMGVEIVGESVKTQYVPNADDLAHCFNLGKTIAEKLNSIV